MLRGHESDDKYHKNGSDQAGIDSDQLQIVKRDTDQDKRQTNPNQARYGHSCTCA